jgi:hypothetical protein
MLIYLAIFGYFSSNLKYRIKKSPYKTAAMDVKDDMIII